MNQKVYSFNLNDKIFALLLFLLILSNSLLGNDYSLIKGVFLIALSLFVLFESRNSPLLLRKEIIFVFSFILFFAFSVLIGIGSGYEWNESCSRLLRYYILFPIIILIISHSYYIHPNRKVLFFKVLDVSTLIIILMCVFEQLFILKYISVWPFHKIMNIEGLVLSGSQTTIQLSCETIFSFLLPYYIIQLLDKNTGIIKKIIPVLFVFYLLLSERKILILVFAVSLLALIIKFIITMVLNRNKAIKIVVTVNRVIYFILVASILIFVLVYLLTKIDISTFFNQLSDHMSEGLSSSNDGIQKRTRQMGSLVSGWINNPLNFIFGNGCNSYLVDDLASTYYKWNYEVFYAAWLYQFGLVGLFFMLATFYYIISGNYFAFKRSRNKKYLYIIFAFICAIISAGTNPCINEYWFFLLPLVFLSEKNNIRKELSYINNNEHYLKEDYA